MIGEAIENAAIAAGKQFAAQTERRGSAQLRRLPVPVGKRRCAARRGDQQTNSTSTITSPAAATPRCITRWGWGNRPPALPAHATASLSSAMPRMSSCSAAKTIMSGAPCCDFHYTAKRREKNNGTYRVNGERLWQKPARHGAVRCHRRQRRHPLALSEEDRLARDQLRLTGHWRLVAACASIGWATCSCAAKRSRPERRAVVTGSHGDSQRGGRFDSIYGVLAGLEVIRSLSDRQIVTERAIEVINGPTRGARFAPAMIASGCSRGIRLEYGLTRRDEHGVSLGEALAHRLRRASIRWAACRSTPPSSCTSNRGRSGSGTPRHRRRDRRTRAALVRAEVVGFSAHAGTTPMDRRRDACWASPSW